MSSKGGSTPTIATYRVGLQYVLCHGPIDKILKIFVGEKLAWEGTGEDQDQITIDKPDLFGGTSREGGVTGKVDLFFGRVTQPINDYIQNKLRGGVDIPKFIGVAMAVCRGVYVGTNYYLKPWWFLATRIHVRKLGIPQWQDALAEVPVNASFGPDIFKSLTYVGTTATATLYSLAEVTVGLSVTIAGSNYSQYNGTFTVTSINREKNKFTYTMGGTPAGNSSIASLTLSYNLSGLINGVHVIRDCLTDSSWGLGHSEFLIDETTFLAAAQTCYDEGLGFGFLWDGEKPVTDFIDDVLKHIQGSLYVNRTTGKFELKLTRYVTDTGPLILLNDSNISSLTDLKKKSLDELINNVTVKFLNNSTLKDDSYNISDSSLAQRQGAIIPKTVTYSGVTNLYLAQKFAIRDLHQLSTPIYTCTIKCGRIAEDLNPGDAFRLYQPELLDAELVMRVTRINLGTIDKGEITIEAVQDIFHAATVIYESPSGTNWLDPISEPVAVTYRLLNEIPYYILATHKGDTFAQAVDSTTSYLIVAAVSPISSAFSAGLWTGPGASTANLTRYGVVDFCFSATLGANISKIATSISIENVIDIELLTVNKFIQLGTELMEVTAITETDLTVIRGVLDTVPVTHTAGDRIYGWHNFAASDDVTYTLAETTYVSLTTITPKGEMVLENAPDSLTFAGRLHMPYPPGNLKIDTAYWPATATTGTIDITWAHRNRLQQTAGLIGYYTTDVTTEASVTYSWELIRTDTLAVLDSATGVTDNFDVMTTAYEGEVKLSIWSVRDTFTSFQTVEHIFTLVP